MFRSPLVEVLENRSMFAAVIGATSGLVASAVGPTVTGFNAPENPNSADRDTGISVSLALTNGAVKASTLLRAQFQIFKDDGTTTSITTGNVQTSGGGDTLSVQPSVALQANTRYRVEINNDGTRPKMTDIAGNVIATATLFFTTNSAIHTGDPYIKFSQTNTNVGSRPYAATVVGPDHRLYAATLDGVIYNWAIGSNGALSDEQAITTIRDNNKTSGNPTGKRFITGIVFDPRASASKPVIWVSHGQYAFGESTSDYATNFTGKISRIRGTGFRSYSDVIVGIPRSVKDHLNNQLVFDPAQKNLYFLIPSMNAMGAADATWGNRPENQFSAALMRLDLAKTETYLAANNAIDLTCGSDGYQRFYNPYKGSNPLRFFATGIRNAYDMVFSNGHLYLATNGSSAGGNTPAIPSSVGQIPSTYRPDYAINGNYTGALGLSQITGVNQTEPDVLLDVKEGKYYGHPNPKRGEYILNGGNPTAGAGNDLQEVAQYPAGTQPDRNYVLPAAILGDGFSPDGMLAYNSTAFGGLLNGYILIARYNTGQDIIAVKPNANGTFNINSDLKLKDTSTYLRGTTGFTDLVRPLDIAQDPANGNIYVAQLTDNIGGFGRISVLRPSLTNPNGVLSAGRVVIYAPATDRKGVSKSVTLTNNGDTGLLLDASAMKMTGANRKSFLVTNLPTSDITLRPGESYTFNIKFVAAAATTDISYANLAIATNDPSGVYSTVVQLRGVAEGRTASSVQVAKQSAPAAKKSVFAQDSIWSLDDTDTNDWWSLV